MLRPQFLPHTVTLLLHPETRPGLLEQAPWVADYPADTQPAAAYVCTGHTCQAPVSTPEDLRRQLLP